MLAPRSEHRCFRAHSLSCPGAHSGLGPVPRRLRFWYEWDSSGAGGTTMCELRDLFQWDRFITPTIIKTFYWLVIALITLFGIPGIFSGLAAMAISPFGGFIVLLSSIASVIGGGIFSRIAGEFILTGVPLKGQLGPIPDQGPPP